jgi:hypothetical protein
LGSPIPGDPKFFGRAVFVGRSAAHFFLSIGVETGDLIQHVRQFSILTRVICAYLVAAVLFQSAIANPHSAIHQHVSPIHAATRAGIHIRPH